MSAKDIVLAAAGGGQTTTAIQYVGGKTVTITAPSSDTTISLTNLTGGVSSAPAAGDVVIVSYAIGSGGVGYRSPNVTSNTYTALATLFSDDTRDTSLYVGYKQMGATPDTSVSVTRTGNADYGGVVAIQAYRYCDDNFPIQQAANTATFFNTVRPTPPTITPWDGDCVAVIVGAGAHQEGNVAYTTTGLINFISSGSADTVTDASIGMGFRVIQSGSYSPNRFNFPQSDSTFYSSAGVSVALKPKPNTVIPTFISYRAVGSISGNTITVTKPTDVQENDFLLLTISFQSSAATIVSVPSGFTFVRSDGNTGDSITYTYKKIATSSEPASYSIVQSSTGDFSCVISVFRNANTLNTLGTANSIGAGTLYADSITPTVGGLTLTVYMADNDTSLLTAPADLTQIVPFGGAGTACSQFIFSSIAGPYFATPERIITVSTTTVYVTSFQLQLTQE